MQMTLRAVIVAVMLTAGLTPPAWAQWKERAIGRDSEGNVLNALVAQKTDSAKVRVLVIGGRHWLSTKKSDAFGKDVSVTAIDFPLQGCTFPPSGTAYNQGDIAAHYLWRWIGVEGFDFVFVVGNDGKALKQALESEDVAKVGKVPCQLVDSPLEVEAFLRHNPAPTSNEELAANRIEKRLERTPIEVATALSNHYGKQLKSIAYIPSLAVIERQRLGELTGKTNFNTEADKIVSAWYEKDHQLPPRKVLGGSQVAGYLVFVDAYDRTNNPRAKEIVLEVASIGINPTTSKPVDVIPNHSEMSDSVFMDPPLLAAAGRLSGDERYYEACLNHIRAIRKLCLRSDGIYRHSPLDEAAWGRGNGFPALGLALVLSELPASWSGREEIVEYFQNHLAALLNHQDESGMWHQVVDHPESYREFTSTCMITFAMMRGMRQGLLDKETFQEPANRGWEAIKRRIGTNGLDLIDVCTGTGKQKTLDDYFHRTAILGKDDRGGAMALMVATERAYFEKLIK